MGKTGNWSTTFELHQCEGEYDPTVFNFRWVREGGRLGYSDGAMTLTINEVKELQMMFKKAIKETKLRTNT